MQLRFILSFAYLAGATSALRTEIPEARDFTTTGAPLTVPLKSLDPSPTETDAAVSSAYAQYASSCGAPLSPALQDGLALQTAENAANPVTAPPTTTAAPSVGGGGGGGGGNSGGGEISAPSTAIGSSAPQPSHATGAGSRHGPEALLLMYAVGMLLV
ncbi:hypothetical protein FB451DRAFT_1164017 [Mycena latifolia]|nr:hypothetical protein FB451DRAFT_1164017 [Mycena latifolia]